MPTRRHEWNIPHLGPVMGQVRTELVPCVRRTPKYISRVAWSRPCKCSRSEQAYGPKRFWFWPFPTRETELAKIPAAISLRELCGRKLWLTAGAAKRGHVCFSF